MIKTIMLFALLSFLSLARAQDAYQKVMLENMNVMDTTSDVKSLNSQVAVFAAIYDAKKDWHPLYYECFGFLKLSKALVSNEQKKKAIDKAKELLDLLPANNDEVLVLRALYAMDYLAIDRSEWQTYLPMLQNSLTEAQKINPDNPRSYYLQGVLKYNMPESMGGGQEAGLKLLQQSSDKFASYKPTDQLAPAWGRDDVRKYLNK